MTGVVIMDEQLVYTTRTHAKVLVGPVLLGVAAMAAAIAVAMFVPGQGVLTYARLALWIMCAMVALVGAVMPVLRWHTSTFTVTTAQIQTRRGFFTRSGSDIPLGRVTNVETERSLIDRMFGCGTLVVRDAGSDGGIVLRDIPHVQDVRNVITDLIHGSVGPH